MTPEDHAQAVLDRLEGSPTIGVHDGQVKRGGEPPYVLVYLRFSIPGAGDEPDKSNLNFDSLALDVEAICHCVGGNTTAARAVLSWALSRLLDWTPAIAGRDCSPMRLVDAPPARRDERTGETTQDHVAVFAFTSVPG